jgi:chromosome segregation ATPase
LKAIENARHPPKSVTKKLEKQLQALNASQSELRQALKTKNKELSNNKKELSSMKKQMSSKESASNNAVAKLQKSIQSLTESQSRLKQELTAKNKELSAKSKQAANLEKQMSKLTKTADNDSKKIGKQIEQLNQTKSRLSDELKDLDKQSKEKNKELAAKNAQLSSLEKEDAKLKQKVEQKLEKLTKIKKAPAEVVAETLPEENIAEKKAAINNSLNEYVLSKYPKFPKDAANRIELERFLARLLQEKHQNFTISQILTLMINLYQEADEKRDKIMVEIKRWVDDDSFVGKTSSKEGVTRYKLM